MPQYEELGIKYVKVFDAAIMLPVDIQSHMQRTIQTHNAVNVGASGSALQVGNYTDADGFNDVAITFMNDAATASAIDLSWSHDGVTEHGKETGLASGTTIKKVALTTTKARYLKVIVTNADAAAHIMSAWLYLKS